MRIEKLSDSKIWHHKDCISKYIYYQNSISCCRNNINYSDGYSISDCDDSDYKTITEISTVGDNEVPSMHRYSKYSNRKERNLSYYYEFSMNDLEQSRKEFL